MAKVEIVIPRMGESIIEATITRWLKAEGDMINEDDAIAEIATDKVDSEITSPISGKFIKKFYNEGDTVAIGTVIALVANEESDSVIDTPKPVEIPVEPINISAMENSIKEENTIVEETNDKFYSPLVKSIAKAEGISLSELDTIKGTAKDGRLNKEDVLNYIKNKGTTPVVKATPKQIIPETPKVISSSGDQIVEMDRMRKLIADHMVMSKHTSPHVTSFIEVDMTNIVMWRNKTKDSFEKREREKLTFTPIFIEAAAKALKEYPGVNASVDGTKIILRKNINIGMATALPNGNLIVPVIKNADQKNLLGISKTVNDLANRARINKLNPEEIQEGTFTITNLGSFGSITGTPIINQPQVAILAIGVIQKKPVVIETPQGDTIGIRHMMIMSIAFDHRVVDGAMGGLYLKRVAEYLENFDVNQTI